MYVRTEVELEDRKSYHFLIPNIQMYYDSIYLMKNHQDSVEKVKSSRLRWIWVFKLVLKIVAVLIHGCKTGTISRSKNSPLKWDGTSMTLWCQCISLLISFKVNHQNLLLTIIAYQTEECRDCIWEMSIKIGSLKLLKET